MTARKKYANDRLTEVICQLTFDTPSTWNGSIYGRFGTSIHSQGFTQFEDVPLQLPVPFAVIGTGMMRYRKVDSPLLVQLSPSICTVNHLPNYPGWPIFKIETLPVFKQLAEFIPAQSVKQVSMRYINRFVFDQKSIALEEWFAFCPKSPFDDHGHFYMKYQMQREDGQLLTVSLGTAEPQENEQLAVLLELDCSIPVQDDWNYAKVAENLEIVHSRLNDAFEAIVTLKTKALLEEGEKL